MIDTRTFLQSVCAAALLAVGISAVSAQMPQTIVPPSATPIPGPMPEVLQNYTPVTAERLKNPEDGNWFHFRRTYDGWGFSPLKEITPDNVARLQPVWSMATGQVEGHQAPPIVNNGVMFVATPGNQMLAIEATTGNILWRYKRTLPEDVVHLHPTNRGVALYTTRSTLRPPIACWSRSTPRLARKSGPPRSMITRKPTTCRSRRSSSTAR